MDNINTNFFILLNNFLTSISILEKNNKIKNSDKIIKDLQCQLNKIEFMAKSIKDDSSKVLSNEEKDLLKKCKNSLSKLVINSQKKRKHVIDKHTNTPKNTINTTVKHNNKNYKQQTSSFEKNTTPVTVSDIPPKKEILKVSFGNPRTEFFTITELYSNFSTIDDVKHNYEYTNILSSQDNNHIYKLTRYKVVDNIVYKYSNFIYGIIDFTTLNSPNLYNLDTDIEKKYDYDQYVHTLINNLSITNLEKNLIDCYGNIGVLEKNKYNAYTAKPTRNNNIEKLIHSTLNKSIHLKRFDDVKMIITEIGNINVFKNNKQIDSLKQYIVTKYSDFYNYEQNIIYGSIDFERLNNDIVYKDLVTNTLLTNKNISDKYVGKISYNSTPYMIKHTAETRKGLSNTYSSLNSKHSKLENIDIP